MREAYSLQRGLLQDGGGRDFGDLLFVLPRGSEKVKNRPLLQRLLGGHVTAIESY